jgi:hypothetical protein
MNDVVRKKEFAALTGVTAGRVSQFIAEGKIGGDALVGRGCRARINVPVALEQLKKNLDSDRHLGFGGKAKLDQKPLEAPKPSAAITSYRPTRPRPPAQRRCSGMRLLKRPSRTKSSRRGTLNSPWPTPRRPRRRRYAVVGRSKQMMPGGSWGALPRGC